MVTATFVTYEKEWPEIDEVIEASARSMEVDWERYVAKLDE